MDTSCEGSMSLPPRHIRRYPVGAEALLDLALWTRERKRMSSSRTTSLITPSLDTSYCSGPDRLCYSFILYWFQERAVPSSLGHDLTRVWAVVRARIDCGKTSGRTVIREVFHTENLSRECRRRQWRRLHPAQEAA